MKPLACLIFICLGLIAFAASACHSGDARRHWRTAAFLLAICFAFSLVWAVWK